MIGSVIVSSTKCAIPAGNLRKRTAAVSSLSFFLGDKPVAASRDVARIMTLSHALMQEFAPTAGVRISTTGPTQAAPLENSIGSASFAGPVFLFRPEPVRMNH
jgi:hypothetical protein